MSRHLFHFSYYNFLWKDDMHGNFNEFIAADPGALAIKREVEHYLYIEKKVGGRACAVVPNMSTQHPRTLSPTSSCLCGSAAFVLNFGYV